MRYSKPSEVAAATRLSQKVSSTTTCNVMHNTACTLSEQTHIHAGLKHSGLTKDPANLMTPSKQTPEASLCCDWAARGQALGAQSRSQHGASRTDAGPLPSEEQEWDRCHLARQAPFHVGNWNRLSEIVGWVSLLGQHCPPAIKLL